MARKTQVEQLKDQIREWITQHKTEYDLCEDGIKHFLTDIGAYIPIPPQPIKVATVVYNSKGRFVLCEPLNNPEGIETSAWSNISGKKIDTEDHGRLLWEGETCSWEGVIRVLGPEFETIELP